MKIRIVSILFAIISMIFAGSATAANLADLLQDLPSASYSEKAEIAKEMMLTGDERAAGLIKSLREGDLYSEKETGQIAIKSGKTYTDALTGDLAEGDFKKIRVNNKLRSSLDQILAAANFTSENPRKRIEAANSAFNNPSPDLLPILREYRAEEPNADVQEALDEAIAATTLQSDASYEDKTAAINTLASLGSRGRPALQAVKNDPQLKPAYDAAMAKIESSERLWGFGQNLWYGISAGSVLLLAAIGLSITFGVMGVINMAHGELIMIGAYTTFVVQSLIARYAPGLLDYALFFALPAAFFFTAFIGILIERGIVRHLYGRPLETLLATWGVSLILQQAIRSIFGPNNREVSNPSWMSGSVEIGQLTLTWNRIWILFFSLAVFAGLLVLLRKSFFGLQIRAVTQNRAMAANMAIRTGHIDALAFGLGAGIAGLAGVALSQIDNVSPNLGQSYIIDSFMVVVFGGVGNLWGAFAGAFTLGIANKFLEPFAGAMLAKIIILIAIILFIQRRPRGLFAPRGRAVES